ncbi:MAG TPA: transglutaminase-like cysteine peptidase [Dongiaceae bacterium]|jgi:predicted transglutaminase-like cysteine proteinase|nr:transglutaminase-like cysteine peptidase [Dongiaceae bacterium]
MSGPVGSNGGGRNWTVPQRRRLSGHAWPIVALGILALSILGAGPASARSYPSIFGSKEISSTNWGVHTSAVVNWMSMLKRWANGTPCAESNTCTTKGWQALVAQVKAAGDPMAQIKLANSLMNNPAQHPYIEDINNWGVAEYWATAYQFMRKSGDCEDFSIAKYMLLKAAGFPIENMRIVAVRIKSLGGIGHAILVVYQGNQAFVLDNRVPPVMQESLVRNEFQPAISMNEQFWWVHLPGR